MNFTRVAMTNAKSIVLISRELSSCSLRDYFQVLAIIAGTAILSMGKKVGTTSICLNYPSV